MEIYWKGYRKIVVNATVWSDRVHETSISQRKIYTYTYIDRS